MIRQGLTFWVTHGFPEGRGSRVVHRGPWIPSAPEPRTPPNRITPSVDTPCMVVIPPGFTAIIDTREKLPYPLILADGTQLPFEIGTLKTGDYSIKGFEEYVSYERKSLMDLLGCIGKHRERFQREVSRLESKLHKGIVVEGSWRLIESGTLSRLHPNAAIGSLLSWVSRGIPVLMLENRERANEYVCRLLLHAYKRLSATGVDDDQDSLAIDSVVPTAPNPSATA